MDSDENFDTKVTLPDYGNRTYVHFLVKFARSSPTAKDIPLLRKLGEALHDRASKDAAREGARRSPLTKLMLAAESATVGMLSNIEMLGWECKKLEEGHYTENIKQGVALLEAWWANTSKPLQPNNGSSEATDTNPNPTFPAPPIDSAQAELNASSEELDENPVSNETGAISHAQGSTDPVLLSSPEGKRLLKLHLTRERNPKLAKEKKRLAQAEFGCLCCAVCTFDFSDRYGSHGDGFIECHHTKPLSDRLEEEETLLEDLELVCANCHRMLHRGRQMLSLSELHAMLR